MNLHGMDQNLFLEAIRDAKARRQTELYWCKCVEDCLCDHCKPDKHRIAISQIKKACRDERIVRLLETGKYRMRNQQHVLSKKTLASILRKLAAELDSDTESYYD